MDKERIGKSIGWGVGAFDIIMKSKLVSIGCFLVIGFLHIIDPSGGLNFTARLLAGFIALYALLSFILLLTDNNQKIAKGKEIAGGLVKGVINGNRDPIVQGQELTSKNKVVNERQKQSNSKLEDRMQSVSKKQQEEPKAGKVVMCIFYAILFIGAVILFFQTNVTVTAVHIIVGALMIADGVSSIAAVVSAKRNGMPMKDKTFSIIANVFSIVIGAAFIILSKSTAEITMIICGIVLMIKGLSDLFVMIQNRSILSSAKGTINEIKHQGSNE